MNFNSYLGGGETLLVRLAKKFKQESKEFLLLYKAGSYIESDLIKENIPQDYCIPVQMSIDYYYLNDSKRKCLINYITSFLKQDIKYELFSFCLRDLYIATDLTKENFQIKLIHLVLHSQDNLCYSQTLIDKIRTKLFNRRFFSNKSIIDFNARLLNTVNRYGTVIHMTEICRQNWVDKFGIIQKEEQVVPLPCCSFGDYNFNPVNNKKIIWIGRLVDFKIPSLCSMLLFLKNRPDYSLTIIGYGAEKYIHNFMKSHNINPAQVRFEGKVDYDKIGSIIKEHSIGYAMGTSIIEIAHYGIPVIMALPKLDYKLFKREICGGLYVNISKGDVGSFDNDESHYPTISDTINLIERNYKESSKDCYEFIKNTFDIDKNADNYLYLMKNKGVYHHYDVKIPKAGFLRTLLFNLFR